MTKGLSRPHDMEAGSVINWSGLAASIPARWVLCDGNNGTPDLRDKFVIGAGDTFAPGTVGGNATHDHTFTASGHFHTVEEVEMDRFMDGSGIETVTNEPLVIGTTNEKTERPPYYSLCFIMYQGAV